MQNAIQFGLCSDIKCIDNYFHGIIRKILVNKSIAKSKNTGAHDIVITIHTLESRAHCVYVTRRLDKGLKKQEAGPCEVQKATASL